jgi:hypothetical protein
MRWNSDGLPAANASILAFAVFWCMNGAAHLLDKMEARGWGCTKRVLASKRSFSTSPGVPCSCVGLLRTVLVVSLAWMIVLIAPVLGLILGLRD